MLLFNPYERGIDLRRVVLARFGQTRSKASNPVDHDRRWGAHLPVRNFILDELKASGYHGLEAFRKACLQPWANAVHARQCPEVWQFLLPNSAAMTSPR